MTVCARCGKPYLTVPVRPASTKLVASCECLTRYGPMCPSCPTHLARISELETKLALLGQDSPIVTRTVAEIAAEIEERGKRWQ